MKLSGMALRDCFMVLHVGAVFACPPAGASDGPTRGNGWVSRDVGAFGPGPPPTGKRHCLNGVSLVFRPA
ncbi:MAG: hypothetical protein ACNA7Q_15075 [Rhodobacterales bacterium]